VIDHETCHHLLDSLSDYIDGELGGELCAEIDRHLQGCDNCRIVIDSLRKTVTLYRASAEDTTMPVGVRDRLYARLDLGEFLNRK
jgi:predicted anti-sigma-YlaC factor YlaD